MDERTPSGVLVGGTMRCSACGIGEMHGCPGPSRRWQNELVREVVKLQDRLALAEKVAEAARWACVAVLDTQTSAAELAEIRPVAAEELLLALQAYDEERGQGR